MTPTPAKPPRRLLEVCVDSVAGLVAATQGGADRIELCAALGIGGLTPPESLIRAAAAGTLPVHLLCRPREGDFIASTAERALVADDIRLAAEAGLAGVVIGASEADRRLNQATLAERIAHACTCGTDRTAADAQRPSLRPVFDLVEALEQAVAVGLNRMLTSEGPMQAIDGAAPLIVLHHKPPATSPS